MKIKAIITKLSDN